MTGTQRAAAKEATRARLLDAAARVIDERGLVGTSIREIAKAAGVAEGSVYNHFADKAELLADTIAERLPRVSLREASKRLVLHTGTGDPRAHLREFAVDAIDGYRELDLLIGLLSGAPDVLPGFRARMEERQMGPVRAHSTLEAFLRVEEEQDRLPLLLPPAVSTISLLGGCHEYAFQTYLSDLPPFDISPEVFATRLIDGLFPVPKK